MSAVELSLSFSSPSFPPQSHPMSYPQTCPFSPLHSPPPSSSQTATYAPSTWCGPMPSASSRPLHPLLPRHRQRPPQHLQSETASFAPPFSLQIPLSEWWTAANAESQTARLVGFWQSESLRLPLSVINSEQTTPSIIRLISHHRVWQLHQHRHQHTALTAADTIGHPRISPHRSSAHWISAESVRGLTINRQCPSLQRTSTKLLI